MTGVYSSKRPFAGVAGVGQYRGRGGIVPPGSPRLWYLASNLNGANNAGVDDADPIGTWTNLGSDGTGSNAVQAVSGARPSYDEVEATLGDKAIDFDGSDYMQTATIANLWQPSKICLVYRQDSGAVSTNFIEGLNSGNRQSISTSGGGSRDLQIYAGSSVVASGKLITFGAWHMVIVSFNGAASYVRLDGSQSANLSPGTHKLAGLTIGGIYSGSSFLNGAMAEVIVYDNGTSIVDTDVEDYFSSRYGAGWPKT